MSAPLVIYHANCWDGFCAAWVARRYLGDIEAVPAHYGSSPPDVRDRIVYVLDFSYPREVMLAMHAAAASLLVLDHHATAKAALDGLPFCTFADDRSGGRMAWDHFAGHTPRPWLVDYTEDRDLWRHALPASREINAALRSWSLAFATWDTLESVALDILTGQGEAILRAERQIVDAHVRNAGRMALLGYNVPVVNATTLVSEIAGQLATGEPFAVCYFDRHDGKRQWSLRSAPDGVDVSEIAQSFGGGGHTHAAGFETDLPAGTLGATQRLSEGQLNADDEGELRFAIGHRDGSVVLDFGKPVSWVGFPPTMANDLIRAIAVHASALRVP